MENVITEFKVIETDDGFRIEIKGDKEQIKACMSGFGGRKGWGGGHSHGRRGGWGPMGFNPMMWMNMAHGCGMWDFEDDEAEEAEEA